jgi:dTDP-4-amino-4,6-dideoxygalactose transaminase
MEELVLKELAVNGGEPQISYELPSVKDVSGRGVGKEELQLVTEVIESGNMGFIYGTKIKSFQQEWADKYNVNTAVAVSNGTAALHTAMIFLNIGPGDEILVPAITDMGTIIALLYENATPVFVDVDLQTQNMDPRDLEHKITERTKAIMPVHLYGFPCDMDPIMEIARKHNLFVVEDCCQAHLTEYKGRLVGTIGDVGCFSFQQSKQMTTGDGGMVITNRDELCGRKLAHCADKGWPREKYRDHLFLAPNYHMTELQAAVGLAQFRKLEGFIDNRRKTAMYLSAQLKDMKGVYPPLEVDWAKNSYYEYALTIDPEQFRVSNKVMAEALTAEGVKTTPSYLPYPIYRYDLITQRVGKIEEDLCPVAVQACKSMLYIPWNEKITNAHVDDIAAAIKKVLTYFSK